MNSKKERCGHENCNKKLGLCDTMMKCKCEKAFCITHRTPTSHNCQYNFKESISSTDYQKIKETSCEFTKLVKI
jgi:hypothetical protein